MAWIRRAIDGNLIQCEVGTKYLGKLEHGLRQLNLLIGYRRSRAKSVREELGVYAASEENRPLTLEHSNTSE